MLFFYWKVTFYGGVFLDYLFIYYIGSSDGGLGKTVGVPFRAEDDKKAAALTEKIWFKLRGGSYPRPGSLFNLTTDTEVEWNVPE